MSPSGNPHANNESRSRLRVPFGLKDGKMYEPRQVGLGKACGCVCPSCNSPLIARHALKYLAKRSITPHFAHQADLNCAYGRETAIHLAAKQLIENHRKLYLPENTVKINVVDEMGKSHTLKKTLVSAGMKHFSSVRLEQNISDFRPDLVATTIHGNDLLVEIAVTHFVDEIKQKKIEAHGIAAIEIDASKIIVFNFESLNKLLFETSQNIKWLFHPRDEVTKSMVLARLAPKLEASRVEAMKKEAHRLIQIRKKEEQHRIELERQKRIESIEQQRQARLEEQKLLKIERFKSMSISQKLGFSLMCLNIDEASIPFFLNQKVRCEQSFKVPRVNWQLAIFGAFIQKMLKSKNYTFMSDEVVIWLEQRFDINVNPKYPNSHKVAVWDFLTNLSNMDILGYVGHRAFEVKENDIKIIMDSYRGLPKNILNVNLNNFCLEWEISWPDYSQIERVFKRYERNYIGICNWERLADLMPSAKNKTPREIASIYAYREDDSVDILLKFMVEARFINAVAIV